MANFTCDLRPDAEDDLADLYLSATDPTAVTAADAAGYRLLTADPYTNGTPLPEGLWRLIVAPLAFFYAIDETARHVSVTNIRRVKPNPNP